MATGKRRSALSRRSWLFILPAGLAAVLTLAVSGVAAGGSSPASKWEVTPLTADSTYVGAKSQSGYAAQTDPSLLGRTDSTPVNVMIKYDYDSTAAYGGGVAGLAPTSPAVTGKKLKNNKDAVQRYEQYTAGVSQKITSAVEKVSGVTVRQAYRTVYGGVEAQVPADKVGELLKIEGVVAVQRDSLQQPQTDATPQFVGATDVWPSIGGSIHAAENVVVGVLDTGIWPEHPSFRDTGLPAPPGGPYGCQFGDGSDVAHLGPTFACNRKLVGAYAKTTTYMNLIGAVAGEFCNNATKVCSARDAEGHGTHTSSTAAGDPVEHAPLLGVDRGPISGIAPGARVIMYRVCMAQGCFSSDSVSAVQQAILDDVDVINYSISGGGNPFTDPVEQAFLEAFRAGISVNASAGNSGPGAATADHGGPWVTTVGASTSNRFFTSTLHLAAPGGATMDKPGVTVTDGIASTPIVLASSIPGYSALCLAPLPPGTIGAGKVVACQRGTNARVDKGFNVLAGGAAGMVLYNLGKQDVETDNHWLKAIHVDGPNADLVAFLTAHPDATANWTAGVRSATQGDVMAAFSSRGPLGDWIKPDITAPGIQVLAGHTPAPIGTVNGPSGQLYQAIAGTSMSSPHLAGASALVKAAHPDWTPAMIKSALMSSAEQDAVKEDGLTPATPFDDGAGALRVNRAVNPTLVFDETYDDFVAAGGDPLHRIDLNLASIDAPTMTGQITTKRTAMNVSGKDQELEVSTLAPAGAAIIVSDKAPGPKGPGKGDDKLHLEKNKPLDFWVTISAPEVANGQYFGQITLDPKKKGYNAATIPVAFNKRQGLVTLSHVCDPTSFPARTGHAHCIASVANLASVPADASLNVTNLDKGKGLDFSNISAPATAIKKDDGVQWSGTLSPALPPQVTSITAGGDIGGYLPLSLFGVAKLAGVGDDTITNIDVPTRPFTYGGETYTRIGVVSNGYLVIGGGTGADIIFTPQTFPNPARPNNVVAPFWNDLNPAAPGLPASAGIRAAVLTDGVTRWIVIDWAGIPPFSGGAPSSFEVWIETAATGEGISLEYGTVGASDPASGVNFGAENRDGTSGRNISPAPVGGNEYTVNLTPPVAGGSVSVEYDASARKAGTYRSIAGMTSNVTPGITQVVQTLTATP